MLRDVDRQIAALCAAAQAQDRQFEVPRFVDGERVTVLVGSHELTEEDVAGLSHEERAAYEAEEARWQGVAAECERLERESRADDVTGADDPAAWKDGEAATLNGEPLPETEAECLAAE